VLAAICCLSLTTSASAQYFGQNKVQYKHLEFQVLKTEHFDIYYSLGEREAVDIAARLAERWYSRLSRILVHRLIDRQPLVLYGSHQDFQQTNVISGDVGEGTGGFTEPRRRRIVLPLAGPLVDTDHVIGHELVHAFQFDMTSLSGASQNCAGCGGAARLPLWFIEGMAEYCSLGPIDPNTAMWLRDAARLDRLPTIDELDNPKYFPYRWGQAFWAYVGGRWGDSVIRSLFIHAAESNVRAAIEQVLGRSSTQLSTEWHAAIRQAYGPVAAMTTPPGSGARTVIKASGGTGSTGLGGELNVGPAISPDGRWVAFLSTRSVFSTDLYVAETASGRIVRKLTNTARNPHFSSLQFIYSAGAWNATGTRLAVAAMTSGHPTLAIFAADSWRQEREVSISNVDEIINPTWAPDDHAVCFTGMSQGFADLYVYDLAASKLHRLTNDAYADLHPAWSPDGRRIAFATDRFTTRLDTLAIGPYRLALIDPGSGTIERLPGSGGGDDINPQWSPDGGTIYFISNRTGIPNLYGLALETGALRQLTNVATGLSGITRSSPTMSIAARSGLVSFSAYEGGRYDIYAMDVSDRGRISNVPSAASAVLPPIDRKPSEVAELIASPTTGLPLAPESSATAPYSPKLLLEGVGQPSIAVGASSFGATLGGAASFAFGDMLEDRLLATAVQFVPTVAGNLSFKDAAAQVAYLNLARRWNWGVVAGQIPYISGAIRAGIVPTQGGPVEVEQAILVRQTERSATGIAAYPFNHAARVEFRGGVSQISFDQIVQTTAYSVYSGQALAGATTVTPLAPSLGLGTSGAALVFDTASFGATSPVDGQRFRMDAEQSFGTINFTQLLGDYRRYFMPVPFYTLATRIIHYGRYGSGSEDPRLLPMFLGYPTLIRGYDINSFAAGDCVPTVTSQCPALEPLLGSRMLVTNVEFRFPLLRPFGVSRGMYGPVPMELGVFTDGGVAWDRGERPSLLGGSRQGVSSAGVVVRANFRGFAVAEFDVSRPFQNPGRGWVFQFGLTPGF
jgi:Tol biopolymer transport system component